MVQKGYSFQGLFIDWKIYLSLGSNAIKILIACDSISVSYVNASGTLKLHYIISHYRFTGDVVLG